MSTKLPIIVIGALTLCGLALGGLGIYASLQWDRTQKELEATKGELTTAQAELEQCVRSEVAHSQSLTECWVALPALVKAEVTAVFWPCGKSPDPLPEGYCEASAGTDEESR